MSILGILRNNRVTTGQTPQGMRSVRRRAQIEETQREQIETPGGGGTATRDIDDVCGLKMATLNIQDGRRNRLNAALRCMKQMEIDLGVLTETKFQNDKFTKAC